MPELLSIRQISLEFADLARRSPIERPSAPLARDPGIHQSDILRWIAINKTGKMKYGERLEEDYPWRMALGNMWEEFYFSLRPDYIWQPGERVVDGVALNADGLGEWEDEVALIDTKCTERKVCSTLEGWLESWITEHAARAYLYCYGPRVFVWPVMHYRGDYAGSGPLAVEYVARFSDFEVESTWTMIQRWKDEARKALGHIGGKVCDWCGKWIEEGTEHEPNGPCEDCTLIPF